MYNQPFFCSEQGLIESIVLHLMSHRTCPGGASLTPHDLGEKKKKKKTAAGTLRY